MKKECISLNLFFVLFIKKAKGTHISEFWFYFLSEKGTCHGEVDFSFPGGSKIDEIHFLENCFLIG